MIVICIAMGPTEPGRHWTPPLCRAEVQCSRGTFRKEIPPRPQAPRPPAPPRRLPQRRLRCVPLCWPQHPSRELCQTHVFFNPRPDDRGAAVASAGGQNMPGSVLVRLTPGPLRGPNLQGATSHMGRPVWCVLHVVFSVLVLQAGKAIPRLWKSSQKRRQLPRFSGTALNSVCSDFSIPTVCTGICFLSR